MFSNTAGSLFSTNQPVQTTTPILGATTGNAPNPNKDHEVPSPPEDTVSSLHFSPNSPNPQVGYLCSSSWDGLLRVWEVNSQTGINPVSQQSFQNVPVLDSCWSNDGTKIFAACADNKGFMWDVASNQMQQFAAHDAPIKTVHYIQSPSYTCVMTGSFDKTLRFWDLRQASPAHTVTLPERVYCTDVYYPLAMVATAGRQLFSFHLEGTIREIGRMESMLKYQSSALAIFLDKQKQQPSGFALGCIEGRVAIQYLNTPNPKDNFTFKCHRSQPTTANVQDIYCVNGIAFHPVHGTLATIGSDGRYTFWDKDAQTKLKNAEQMDLPLTACTFDSRGLLFAYALGYDWSLGHEGNNPNKKPQIFLRQAMEDLKPTQKKN